MIQSIIMSVCNAPTGMNVTYPVNGVDVTKPVIAIILVVMKHPLQPDILDQHWGCLTLNAQGGFDQIVGGKMTMGN